MKYESAYQKIFAAEGSIWKAPNNIWSTGFAENKRDIGIHPAIVERARRDGVSIQLAPGTSKNYKIGSCVFTVKFNKQSKNSYFLLLFSMPYHFDQLINLTRGWDQRMFLTNKEILQLKQQIAFCKG